MEQTTNISSPVGRKPPAVGAVTRPVTPSSSVHPQTSAGTVTASTPNAATPGQATADRASVRSEPAKISESNKNIDFARNQIFVRRGKNNKDRMVPLPQNLKQPLQEHLLEVKKRHDQDLKNGFGEVDLPHALNRKYPQASTEFAWQLRERNSTRDNPAPRNWRNAMARTCSVFGTNFGNSRIVKFLNWV